MARSRKTTHPKPEPMRRGLNLGFVRRPKGQRSREARMKGENRGGRGGSLRGVV